jgi:hypothetical protein
MTKVDYKDAELTPLIGYEYTGADISYTYRQSEKNTFSGSVSLTHLDVPKTKNETDTRILGLSVTRQIGEKSQINASVNHRYSEFSGSIDDTDEGYGGNLELDYIGERNNWSSSVSVAIQPYGNGVLAEERKGILSYSHSISPFHHIQMYLGLLNSKDIRNETVASNRDYGWIEGRLEGSLAENWWLNFGYRYAGQKYETDTDASYSNIVYAYLQYRYKK